MKTKSLEHPRKHFQSGREIFLFAALACLLILLPAVVHSADVTLAWDANSESDLAGYILYYGTSSGNYTSNIDVGNITQYTIAGLQDGETYYFAVTAYNDADLESDYSEELAHMVGNGFPTTPAAPAGPSSGYTDTSYAFNTSASDPDGDPLEYQFDWGDATQSGWEPASNSHAWSAAGTYCVKVRARDIYGAESGWSNCHSITLAELTHTITASAGAQGSIAPSGDVTVSHGSSQTFAISSQYVPQDYGEDNNASQPGKIWLEAEIGSLNPPMEIVEDTGTSSGQFIYVPEGNSDVDNPLLDVGSAEYTFEVPESGEYLIWGRVKAAYGGSNSFYISVDDMDYVDWHTQISNVWFWDQVSAGMDQEALVFNLEKGEHRLSLKLRETGTKIDRILIVNRQDSSYQLQDVLVDGNSVGAVDSYTFANVTASHTIEAVFTQQTHTITASAESNGSISPSGTVTVNQGAGQAFTISAAQNYQVLDVLVDGSSVGAVTAYTFSNVVQNHTISASFVAVNQPPVADAGSDQAVTEGATVALNGSNSTDPGGSIAAYAWQQTDGLTVQLSNAETSRASFLAPNVGMAGETLTFRLTVTDNGGLQDVDTCVVTVTKAAVVDSDGDGVSDDLDAFPYDADEYLDTDADGLGNNADTDDDNDGLPDEWELAYGLDPLLNDAAGDPDGDGVSNINEYNLGTAPDHSEGNFDPSQPILLTPENGGVVGLTPRLETDQFDDPNANDVHSATQWQIVRAFDDVCVFDVTTTTSLTSITIPNHVLEEDTDYIWKAKHFDGHNGQSEWSAEREFNTGYAANDLDKNGVPDNQEVSETLDLDADGEVDKMQNDIKCVNVNDNHEHVQICVSIRGAQNAYSIQSLSVQDPADPELNSKTKGKPNFIEFEMLEFKVLVNNPGDETTVTIYLSKPAFKDGNCFKYDPVNGVWLDYSGYTEFSNNRKEVHLTLEDGGFGDADGIANGIIVDPLAFGSETDPNGSSDISPLDDLVENALPSDLSCFISAAAAQSTDPSWRLWDEIRGREAAIFWVVILLLLAAKEIWRRRRIGS